VTDLSVSSCEAEEYCNKEGLEIVGVYHANELLNDNAPGAAVRKIADTVASASPPGCILTVLRFLTSSQPFTCCLC
jgi:hypothetical protein